MVECNAKCQFDIKFYCDYCNVLALNVLLYFLQRIKLIKVYEKHIANAHWSTSHVNYLIIQYLKMKAVVYWISMTLSALCVGILHLL